MSSPTIPPRLAKVPAFPPVVMRLLSLLADDQSSISGIAACIATDPIFSARVLKRANAADIAHLAPATDILGALVTLGMERTRELTLTIATIAYLGSALKEEQLRKCWCHTIACAITAAEIARSCGVDPAEAYTAGLLHDIGRLGLITAYPAEYERALAEVTESDADILAFERRRFGVDHTEAGRWLAERWGLPGSIAEVAARHHDAPGQSDDVLAVVHVGCRVADLLGYSVCTQHESPDFEAVSGVLPEAVRDRLHSALPRLQSEISTQIEMFGYSDNQVPAHPIQVVIQEDEESDFAVDFGYASPPAAPRPASRKKAIAVAILLLAAAVALFLLR